MELCDQSLEEFVHESEDRIGRQGLHAIDVVYLGLHLADAVHALHYRAAYMHHDIKPANVMLAKPGAGETESSPKTVKLIDFGLAKHLQGVDPTMITQIGTRAYGETEGLYPPLLFQWAIAFVTVIDVWHMDDLGMHMASYA